MAENELKDKFPAVFAQLADERGQIDGLKLRHWTMKQKLPSCNFLKMIEQCLEYLKVTCEPLKEADNTNNINDEANISAHHEALGNHFPESENPADEKFQTQSPSFEQFFTDSMQQDLLLSQQMIHGVFRDASDEDLENSNILAEQDALYAKDCLKSIYETKSKADFQLDDFSDLPWHDESAIQDFIHEFIVLCK